MNWPHKTRLRRLFLSEAKHARTETFMQAFKAMQKTDLRSYNGTFAAPASQIRTIYERRATYDPCPARGFEQLLPALRATTDGQVRLHGFMVDGTAYEVFTNVATTQLHGVLAIDVRRQVQAGWFDKRGRPRRRPTKPAQA